MDRVDSFMLSVKLICVGLLLNGLINYDVDGLMIEVNMVGAALAVSLLLKTNTLSFCRKYSKKNMILKF